MKPPREKNREYPFYTIEKIEKKIRTPWSFLG